MKALRVIHTSYGVIVFTTLFLLLLPFLFIPILFPKQFRLVGIINRWWAKLLFTFIFIPFYSENRAKLDPKKQYIFCPNHFSYLDIPALGLCSHNTIFVGKSEMSKVPLFGFMYRKLHITVDRTKLKSRYASLEKSMQAIARNARVKEKEKRENEKEKGERRRETGERIRGIEKGK